MVIFVDIDETIATFPQNKKSSDNCILNYGNVEPIFENIEKINKLYDLGHTIVYYTARGSVSGINWFQTTQIQLKGWGCKYHELRMGKPPYDLIIDDKSKRIEEI